MNCQHEIPYEDRAGHLKSRSCPKDGGRDGWCPDHAHSRELLAKGEQLDYPAIDELHLSVLFVRIVIAFAWIIVAVEA